MNIEETNNIFTKTIKNSELLEELDSDFQNIKIFKNNFFEIVMTLDGIPSISSKFSHRYYETAVNSAVCTNPDVKNALVIGGGNGFIVNELLKHSDIKNITAVEIDSSITKISKKYFPKTASKLEDKKVKLFFEDGYEFVKNAKDRSYDVIFIDTIDALKNSFDSEFYSHISKILNTNGIVVSRAEDIGFDLEKHKKRLKDIGKHFRYTMPFRASDPLSLYGSITLIYASKKFHPTADLLLQKIDMLCDLKHYNAEIHNASFALGSDEFKNLLDGMKL